MKRLSLIVALVAMVAATFAGSASAGGSFRTITAHGQSPIVHYRVRYDVWPGHTCRAGLTSTALPTPSATSTRQATRELDVRVFRTARRWQATPHPPRNDVWVRWTCKRRPVRLPVSTLNRRTTLSYRAVFRLIDPVTDRVVDLVNRKFRV